MWFEENHQVVYPDTERKQKYLLSGYFNFTLNVLQYCNVTQELTGLSGYLLRICLLISINLQLSEILKSVDITNPVLNECA